MEDNRKPARKYLKVLGFEPDKNAWENLSKQKNDTFKYLNTGLFREEGLVDYHVVKKQQVSSIYLPDLKFGS
ncbi:MAG: hypothetical protein QF607_01470 [Nitrospinaceae bacterium]|nr:hypothetical protein [Nitrospinaceae bacterium]